MPRNFVALQVHDTDALILHQTLLGESDVILSLMTEQLGRVDAVARSARKSQKRFGGALEPIHTLRVKIEERSGRDLLSLKEAQLKVPRRTILRSLEGMEAAGRALSWLRHVAPARTREHELYARTTSLLDALDVEMHAGRSGLLLAEFGLQLMATTGFALEFERCVRCDTPCPEGRSSFIDPVRGGLICQKCGGGPFRISGPARARFVLTGRGALDSLIEEDLALAMNVVTRSLSSHVGID
ncbi:MAG: DNA repair protein RecO [Polyangiaceae bacterium]|nr:DNA repair protein RecO [Polyangiaceae bacterium]